MLVCVLVSMFCVRRVCVYMCLWYKLDLLVFLLMERSVCVPGADCAPDWCYMWV